MRVLVLDGSRVLPALVQRLAPEVKVESASTFDEARQVLASKPPQALIVNLEPAPLPWAQMLHLCRNREPPIPVLFESCVSSNAEEAGVADFCANADFLAKPYSIDQFRAAIDRLLRGAAAAEDPTGADLPTARESG